MLPAKARNAGLLRNTSRPAAITLSTWSGDNRNRVGIASRSAARLVSSYQSRDVRQRTFGRDSPNQDARRQKTILNRRQRQDPSNAKLGLFRRRYRSLLTADWVIEWDRRFAHADKGRVHPGSASSSSTKTAAAPASGCGNRAVPHRRENSRALQSRRRVMARNGPKLTPAFVPITGEHHHREPRKGIRLRSGSRGGHGGRSSIRQTQGYQFGNRQKNKTIGDTAKSEWSPVAEARSDANLTHFRARAAGLYQPLPGFPADLLNDVDIELQITKMSDVELGA